MSDSNARGMGSIFSNRRDERMTDINQAGLEAAQLAIAKCKAVGRTTVEDHAYDAITAYLAATEGGEDAPQATGDDLVERAREKANEIERDVNIKSVQQGGWGEIAILRDQATRIEQLEADVERHINSAAVIRRQGEK